MRFDLIHLPSGLPVFSCASLPAAIRIRTLMLECFPDWRVAIEPRAVRR
jgi:hypothetical protein